MSATSTPPGTMAVRTNLSMEAAQAVRPQYRAHWGGAAGLVINLILFCGLFTIKDRRFTIKRTIKVCVSWSWPWPGTSAHSAAPCPCISAVPEVTMHNDSSFPLKSAVSAQRALQGSKTETRELLGGTGEKEICPPGKSMIFHKKETENNWVSCETCGAVRPRPLSVRDTLAPAGSNRSP